MEALEPWTQEEISCQQYVLTMTNGIYADADIILVWDFLYGLGALVTAILGIYSAIFNMNASYKTK